MKNKVLITSIGHKISLIQEFLSAGWDVYAIDSDSSSYGLKIAKEGHIDDMYDLYIPTRDSEISQIWKKNGWDDSCVDICVDKYKFYKWCKNNGFLTPEVYFVKPRISKSGKEVECVWQELIEGEEYSVDLFSGFGKEVISVVPRKRVKILNGESAVTITVRNENILNSAVKLAETLGLVGHNVLQCFLVNGQVIWTDVNCRFGGASVVGIRAGCQSPRWLLNLINGEKVVRCIGNYKVGLTGYSYTEWAFD